MVAFGRDTTNEGRRTNLDYRQYQEDGSNRTRIRYNVKGPRGQVTVWVEISDKMAQNDYVFLICQDKRTQRVITLADNRERLIAEKGSNPYSSALGHLLNGKYFSN